MRHPPARARAREQDHMSDQDQNDTQWFTDLAAAAGQAVTPAPDMATGVATSGETGQPQTPPAKTPQGIQQTVFDTYLGERIQSDVPSFGQMISAAGEVYDPERVKALASDVFASLYKLAPELTPEDAMDPSYAQHRKALEEMMGTTEYRTLWARTQMDDLSAAIGAGALTHHLAKTLAEQEEANPSTPAGEGGEQGGQGQGQGQGGGSGGDGQDGEQDALERQQLRVAARAAAQAAAQDVQDAQDALDAFSGDEDAVGGGWGQGTGGARQSGDVKTRAKMAQTALTNPRLRRIAELVGRMKIMAAAAQRKRTDRAGDEIVDVEVGDDLSRILPSELMRLMDPDLEIAAMRDMIEGGMLQYRMQDSKPEGRGPIILALDESGSMSGGRNDWAAAVFLSLLSIAAHQKRDLRLVHFGGSNYTGPRDVFTTPDAYDELTVTDFPKGQATPDLAMNEALHFFDGGTDYHLWMRASLEAIEANAYNKADVVVVTDGICGVTSDALLAWTKARQEREFKAIGILIGNAPQGTGVLHDLCDEVHNIADVGYRHDEGALNAAFSV